MAANSGPGAKIIAEAKPSGLGIGKYEVQYGGQHVKIVAIGAGKQDVDLSYTKGGKTTTVHTANADEAKADLTAHGIKDEQAHAFVDMARHDKIGRASCRERV